MIFISHSSDDSALAGALARLLQMALRLSASEIRCTSVDGYRLPAGAETDPVLRSEVVDARSFIGILTPVSIKSTYVLFELGARWGAKRHLAPVLAGGLSPGALSGPIRGFNALSCDVSAQIDQLVADLGEELAITPESQTMFSTFRTAVIAESQKRLSATAPLLALFNSRLTGQMTASDTGESYTFFLIPLTLVNRSQSAITPSLYILRVNIDGVWHELANMPIPDDATWLSAKQSITIPDQRAHDLFRIKTSLGPGQSVAGYLMFTGGLFPYHRVQNREDFKLSMACVDILGEEHSIEVRLQPPGLPGATEKLGVGVAPKPRADDGS